MPHHGSKLENVLFPGFHLVFLSELSRQFCTTFDVLRADIVDGDLDAVCRVGDLDDNKDEGRQRGEDTTEPLTW